MRLTGKGAYLVVAAIVVAAGIGAAVHKRGESGNLKQQVQKKMPLVAIAPVQVGSIARVIETTGTIEPLNAVSIVPKVEQRIIWMALREGDVVRRGQVIVRLENTEASGRLSSALADVSVSEARLRDVLSGSRPQEIMSAKAALTQAETGLKQARLDLEHTRKLYGANGIPEQQLREAESRYESAQSSTDSAKATLEDAESDLARLKRMLKIGGVAQEDADKAETRRKVAKSALASAESAQRSAASNLEHVKELDVKVVPRQRIDDAESRYASAQSAVQAAKARLDLLKEGASATQIEVAREQVRQARLETETLRTQTSYCAIQSPVNGVITKLFQNQGDLAQTKQPIMSISENAKMIVKAALTDRDARMVTPGQPAIVKVGGPQDDPIKLKVSRVYPAADPLSRLVPIEIAIPAGAKSAQGAFARVSIVKEKHEGALVIPADAVVWKPGGKAVVFVVEKGIAHMRPIAIGIEGKGKAEVLSGISRGEMLVVKGQEMLKDGVEVKAKRKKGPEGGMSGTPDGNKPRRPASQGGAI